MSDPAPAVRPFTIAVPDDVLTDLRARLSHTRFVNPSADSPWAGGVDPSWLAELVSYWRDGFEWRAAEARLNTYPQFLASVHGRDVHFVWVRGVVHGDAKRIPLVLSHGWPSAFTEYLRVVGLLTDPAVHGLDPSIVFDVVVPSLPGFAFSEPPAGPFTREAVGEIWHTLMTRVLGYERYGLFGGNIGGGVSQWVAVNHPENVIGFHTNHPPAPAAYDPPPTPVEQAYLEHVKAYDLTDQGYSEIMWSRPDTIAAALIDSPAGLAAWIIDKVRAWTGHGDELEPVWDIDSLLTLVTLYWVTGSIGTSFRQYVDYGQGRPRPPISVPSAVTLSSEPADRGHPRSDAERAMTDLRHWTEPGRGGHFIAFEQPELMVEELRAFFGTLR
jgi:pimeloyl-ACP methyl ester carboxylesterase